MVETRRTLRGTVQGRSKDFNNGQVPKAREVAPVSRNKRRIVQRTAEKDHTATRSGSKKRAKKDHLSNLTVSHEAGKDSVQTTRLLKLPGETFEEITSWLEPDSLTCLSLTCKEILSIVGRESWTQCRSRRQYWDPCRASWVNFKHSLIPLLGRDAPHLVVCDTCMTLHPPLKPPREHGETKLTKHCFGQWSSINYLPHDELGGYNLLFEHIVEARKSLTTDNDGSPIEVLDGNFTIRYERLNYTLTSSGRQIGRNLILKHEHIFYRENRRSPLRLADIVNLPIRLCPHQTTSTRKPEPNHYTKGRLPSGLLLYSISAAAPPSLRIGIPTTDKFNAPWPSEKKQIDAAASCVNALWACRACPTKWRVRHSGEGGGELKITAWHSFGDTAYRAQEYWKMLVRRELSNLGDEKRNSEFFAASKQFLDFAIDDEK
ncbi:hypothetical protein D0Z07_5391 [Hyphodiscus hymeniophilus]|uniref:F-box domain-containing protein n=1 Tax=Hyphodiscus hymeniophilus TaxID=353542 RepID=A0A9P7AWE9_9HELO|nr:hypothetical protein D0Z07_5391 [Hyphodiscus hymeniophilus]